MSTDKYLLVSIYLNEADKWEHRPLDLEILKYLYDSGCAGGTVIRGLAGFTKGGGVVTTSIVDIGSKLPVVVQFVEAAAKVDEVMPTLRRMAGKSKRLIIVQEVLTAYMS
jgi:PII-like signaling protein